MSRHRPINSLKIRYFKNRIAKKSRRKNEEKYEKIKEWNENQRNDLTLTMEAVSDISRIAAAMETA